MSVSKTALAKFEEKFEKSYGASTLRTPDPSSVYDVISTGSLAIDYITGVGGFVEGRLVEIWGPDGTGKTTLSLMTCAQAQKKYPDRLVAWIDMEHAFDDKWAADHGIDVSKLKVYTPDSAEDVADAMKDFIQSGFFSIVVLDSVGAMITEKEKEKAADEVVMAGKAKIVTRMVNIAAVEAPKTHTTVVIINQVRANLSYGADTTTGGGFALKHVTTMKLNLKRTGTVPFKEKIGDEERIVGHEIKIRTDRNRVSPAYRTIEVVLFNQPSSYGPVGIDLADEAFTMGRKVGVIEQKGNTYTLPTGESFVGRPKAIDALRADPAAVQTIRERVLAATIEFDPAEVEPGDEDE
jgi:recombination protein RecA